MRDVFYYWSVRRRDLLKQVSRFLLHFTAIPSSAGLILLPLFYPKDFTLEKYNYFLFNYQSNLMQINWIAIIFCILVIFGTTNYIVLNILNIFEPKLKDIISMVGSTARVHFSSGILSTESIDLAEALLIESKKKKDEAINNKEMEVKEIKLNGDSPLSKLYREAAERSLAEGSEKRKKVIEGLITSMQIIMDSIDVKVYNYMDTVQKHDVITSNMMVTLLPDDFGGNWAFTEDMLNNERFYIVDGCDSASCIAWVRLCVKSHNSLEAYVLDNSSFRIHKEPTIAIPGVGSAYHFGLRYAQNNASDLRIAAINDVSRIEWPKGIEHNMKQEADKHFNAIGKIKSFVSIPLVRFDRVVGVFNINSSNYYLAGFSNQPRNILENLIFPSLPYLAVMLELYRRAEYDI